jgi:hypothetical protein
MLPPLGQSIDGEKTWPTSARNLVLAKLRPHRVRHLLAKCRHALHLLVADSIPALAAVVRA